MAQRELETQFYFAEEPMKSYNVNKGAGGWALRIRVPSA